MATEIINGQCLRETICKHVGAAYPLNYKLAICDQLSDIMMLNVDVFGSGLALGILCEDNTGFVVSV